MAKWCRWVRDARSWDDWDSTPDTEDDVELGDEETDIDVSDANDR